MLAERVAGTKQPLTVIVGPPKSGKTRSMVNAIMDFAHPDSTVFWLKPNQRTIDEFISVLSLELPSRPVFVLDDLQKFGPGIPGCLTSFALNKLLECGVVVATVHESILGLAAEGLYDHAMGSFSDLDRHLLAQLQEASIELSAKLSERELESSFRLYDLRIGEGAGTEYLAAYMSAGDLHLSQFQALKRGQALERAARSAITFCHAVSSSGFSLAQLRKATTYFLDLSSEGFDLFEWQWINLLTKLVSVDSVRPSHSLLMRTPDNPELFELMDYVWSNSFQTNDGVAELQAMNVPSPLLIDVDPIDASVSAIGLGLIDWAEEFLRYRLGNNWPLSTAATFGEAPNQISAEEVNLWAYLKTQQGEYSEAFDSYRELAIFLDTHTDAKESFDTWDFLQETLLRAAHCLEMMERFSEARDIISGVIEADPTYAPAYQDLGWLLGRMMKPSVSTATEPEVAESEARAIADEREYCFRTALELSPQNASYMLSLGLHLKEYGEGSEARIECVQLLSQAAESKALGTEDLEYAHQLLGNMAQEVEDYDLAKHHYLEAQKQTTDDWPLVPLAHVCKMLNQLDQGRKYALEYLEDFQHSLWGVDDFAFNLLLEIETASGNQAAVDGWKQKRLEAQIAGLREFYKEYDIENDPDSISSSLEFWLEMHPEHDEVIRQFRLRYGIPPIPNQS